MINTFTSDDGGSNSSNVFKNVINIKIKQKQLKPKMFYLSMLLTISFLMNTQIVNSHQVSHDISKVEQTMYSNFSNQNSSNVKGLNIDRRNYHIANLDLNSSYSNIKFFNISKPSLLFLIGVGNKVYELKKTFNL